MNGLLYIVFKKKRGMLEQCEPVYSNGVITSYINI